MVSSLAGALGYALIILTAVTSAHAVWRRRETHRLDIVGLLAVLALKPLYHTFGALGIGVLLTVPYMLLRLVGHFRDVPSILRHVSAAAIVVGTLVFVISPEPNSGSQGAVTAAFSMALVLYSAIALTAEVRRSSGVTAKRLALAAVGTYLLAAAFLTGTLPPLVDSLVRVGYHAGTFFTTGMLASYYIAFATPRWLRSSWQRLEKAKYLSVAAELNPEERGTRTADDLSRAAASASSNSVTLVALHPLPHSRELVVRASTQPQLVGAQIEPAGNLIERGLRSSQGVTGRTEDCDPTLAGRLLPLGVQVLAAPIVTATRTWGLVLVVQRRGSLFPEDDLQLLVELGRYAGTALDHAQLVAEAHDREQKAADRRIREAESRMALLLDNIHDYALFVLDHRGHIVTWHPGAEHVFGYTAAEMIDEPAADLYSRTKEEFLQLLDEARQLGRAEFEGPCRRRDGAKFSGTTIIRPLSGDDYELEGFVGVTHDVTTQRELEQQLRQSQKMEAIGRLAGGIAHDFNNLLTAILGYADWLIQDFEPGSLHNQQVQEIQNAGERAAGLTRQLLAFSRKQVLQPSPLNLSRLAADLIPMLQRLIGEHITIDDQTSPEIVAVTGDRSQLEQVIVNLVVNARDAMPAGGMLTIRTARTWLDQTAAGTDLLPGPYAMLEVIDTGVGMDVATQNRMFEPFFTTKEFGRGTGLGLSTVYGIVKQMGGGVRVVSAPEHGTTFRLYFPETRMRESASTPPAAVETPRGTGTLLLVEDDDAVRAFLARVLERHGYQVIAAEHQSAALTLARAHVAPIDLVIADIVMPGGTGPELVRALHELQPGVPALYISGYADGVLARQSPPAKASHFLQKPFTAPELLTRIRQILSRG